MLFDDFVKCFRTSHDEENGVVQYDTPVGKYLLAYDQAKGHVTVTLEEPSSMLLILPQQIHRVGLVCCLHHALEQAEFFCCGNYSARAAHRPNPSSKWGRNG